MKKSINHMYLLILLAVLSTIAPLSIAIYLPSMPSMAEDFKIDISQIELSLSIFMFGLALGQIFGGPLSDRKGRKVSSITGLLGFAIFSLLIVFSSSIYELWIYRFMQAFFSGLIVINATAIIRDLFVGLEAAKFFSMLGSIRSIIPMIAPSIGAIILFFFSWKAIFIFLSLYALILAFLIFKDLEESYTYTKKSIFKSYKSVLVHKQAMKMIFVLALGFSSLFAIVTKSSFIYMEYFNVSVNTFPFFYGFNFLVVLFFASLNVKLIRKFEQIKILMFAVSMQICFAFIFTFFTQDLNLYFAVGLIALYLGMNGLIYGNATALIMEFFPKNAGVASALIGVIQFGLASIISTLIVFFHGESLLPIGVGMILIPLISIFIIRKY